MKKFFSSIFFCALASAGFSQTLMVQNLHCEFRENPLGVESTKPKLSWEIHSDQQNVLQTAYRILVADDPALLKKNTGNIWDSKKVLSNASIQVEYKGKPLQAIKKYYWKVVVWDNKGHMSSSGEDIFWQMGLLSAKDWNGAKWIGYEQIVDSGIIVPYAHGNGKRSWGARRNVLPLFRKNFPVNKEVKQATAFICGLGHFELTVNGVRASYNFLDPGWTNYTKHALYVTLDITQRVKTGMNAIGVMLGNGFYYIPGQRYRKMTGAFGLPKMIMRAVIEYTDGSIENIISDESWKTAPSPIIFSSIFGGEDYDAGLEQKDWNTAVFDDSKWKNVVIVNGSPVLESQMAEPVSIIIGVAAKNKMQLKSGSWVYDLGQNLSGIPTIIVSGNKGDTVRIIPAELVNEDGSANQRGSGGPSYFTYILKGEGEERWQPRFTYYGFRYMQVNCIPKDSTQKKPEVLSIQAYHIRYLTKEVGQLFLSNDLFSQTDQLIKWAIKSNMVSVFTDCPHREKLGWLEQTHLMGSSIQYNFDIAALNRKVIKDMMYAQYESGMVPEIAPEFVKFTPPFDESPEWGSAAIILPWYNYQWYGDKQTLIEAYEMMKGYISYLENKAKDNILTHGLGDWYDIGPNRPGFSQMTKMGVTATATYYYDLTIMVQVAKLLNKIKDAKIFEQMAGDVKKSFNEKFFDKQRMKYDSASQTANAMALYMGLVEPQYKKAVLNALVQDIRSRNNALTAGDIGYRYVLRALEDAGRSDVIFDMNNRDDVPGYGYQLKHGATALTESWQAYPSVSNNHLMLGHLMEWFYGGLCGIKQAKDGVAFNKIEIKPQLVGDTAYASATAVFHSPYGDIRTAWIRTGSKFQLEVIIPANTTAVIYLPANDKYKLPIKVGSGEYYYSVTLK